MKENQIKDKSNKNSTNGEAIKMDSQYIQINTKLNNYEYDGYTGECKI